MSWSEAFRRAFQGIISLIVIYIIGFVVLVIGVVALFGAFSGYEPNWAVAILLGLPLTLGGIVIIMLGAFAVLIKILTDSLSESMNRIIGRS